VAAGIAAHTRVTLVGGVLLILSVYLAVLRPAKGVQVPVAVLAAATDRKPASVAPPAGCADLPAWLRSVRLLRRPGART
jgi:hypothetical protein